MTQPFPLDDDPFAARYPAIARWVRKQGWIEIGDDEMSDAFIRALDPGGMVWSGGSPDRPLAEGLGELDAALGAWMRDQLGMS
jgi:hypothetical protein